MADNEDYKPLGVNLSTVGRFGAGGALTGASVASALTFVKLIRDMNEAKKERTAVDEHTLTLTLPPKEARIKEDKDVKVKIDKSKATEKPATTPKQIRSTDGKYNIKTANWQTMASSLLAMGAGGGLGFALVNKAYEHKKERQLQLQLSGAKQEYLDKLVGPGAKVASAPGDASFSYMDYPMGLGALALLLGGGSTAWLTKKILDEYNREPKSDYRPVRQPKIQRIVFKTDGEEPVKTAGFDKDDTECLDAALAVYLDLCSGSPDVLGHEKCAAAMIPLKVTPADLYKMAADDYEQLMGFLHNNPELRTVLKRLAMDRHPVLKYLKPAVNLPVIRGMGDDQLYDGVRRAVGPQHEIFDNVKAETRGNMKTADIASTLGGLMAGSVGASAANLAFENKRKPSGKLQRPEATPAENQADIQRMVDGISLKAEDPQAAAFAETNKDKIKKVLRILAEEGRI